METRNNVHKKYYLREKLTISLIEGDIVANVDQSLQHSACALHNCFRQDMKTFSWCSFCWSNLYKWLINRTQFSGFRLSNSLGDFNDTELLRINDKRSTNSQTPTCFDSQLSITTQQYRMFLWHWEGGEQRTEINKKETPVCVYETELLWLQIFITII